MLAVTTGRLGNSCNAHGEASRKYVPGFQQGIGSYGDPTGDPSTGGPNGGSQQGVLTKLSVFGNRGSPAQAALDVERRQAMSYSISTLLTRNLHGVFGENDPVRRRVAIDEAFTEDCVFYDPSKGVYRGRDEIDRV